jgi:hypothetical protein
MDSVILVAGVNRLAPVASLVLLENHALIVAFSRIERSAEPRDAGSNEDNLSGILRHMC